MEHIPPKTEEELIEKYGDTPERLYALKMFIHSSIQEASLHTTPAPQTIEMFKDLNEKIDRHFNEDKEWKKSVTPSIEVMKSMQSFFSIGAWILKGIILIGAVGSIFVGIYHWFTNRWV